MCCHNSYLEKNSLLELVNEEGSELIILKCDPKVWL